MVHRPVGIRSVALSLPKLRRTNDYYLEKYPELVAKAEEQSLAKIFSLPGSRPENEFDLDMMPYLSDPFRGTIERRILGLDESPLILQERAARDALKAANLSPDQVELMITASVWPNQYGFGDAAFLARQLELQDKAATWSLDANCGSTPVALEIASALVQQGDYHNVLAVISCSNSRFYDEDDTMSWFLGDGAGAFVVSTLEGNQGVLGTQTVHTSALCDVISPICTGRDEQGNLQVRMQMGKDAKALRETALDFLLTCCKGAIAAADVTLDKIDFFLFNTPTAWMADLCTRILGISPERTIDLYPQYANIGPVLTVANLYHAAQLGKIRENDLVLIYGSGAAGAASASVMRWGNVALGREPV